MDRQAALKILEDADAEKISRILQKPNINPFLKLIRQETLRNWNGTIPALKAFFEGSRGTEEKQIERHFEIFQFSLNLLKECSLALQVISNILGLLFLEVKCLVPSKLTMLISEFLTAFETGELLENKWFEVFPKVFNAATELHAVELSDGTKLSGTEYREQIFNSLISIRWKRGVVHLVSIFQDMMLTDEELYRVVKKCLDSFQEMHISDIPPFVYQLLELSGKGHLSAVLEGVMKFFDTKDKNRELNNNDDSEVTEFNDTRELLLATEGTVIHHISFAAKIQPDLIREFIKMLNSSRNNIQSIFLPFSLAVALSLSCRQKHEDQVINILKSSLALHFQAKEKMLLSFWIQTNLKEQEDVSALIITTIQNSKSGWEYITEGLIELGIVLLDSCKTHAKIEFISYGTVNEQMAALGHCILTETFKVHEYVREIILGKVAMKIMPSRMSTSALNRNYIDVFAAILAIGPQTALVSIDKIKRILEHLQDFDGTTAIAFLEALMPLLKRSLTLKDCLMLTLRKAMFTPDLESRKMVVNGYLLILKKFKVLGAISMSQDSEGSVVSLTQFMVEINLPQYNKGANEALCIDLLNILSRSLTQQEAVRSVVYKGLPDVMTQNMQLAEEIMNLLWAKFEKYYEPVPERSPPLYLSSCVDIQMDEATLIEPISDLMRSISTCIVSAEGFEEVLSGASMQKSTQSFESLVNRLAQAELEDFELDKSTDFGGSSVGVKNQILAGQLAAVYEVLMEFAFVRGKMSLESCKSILGLLEIHQKLLDVLKSANKKKTSDGKAVKGRKAAEKKAQPSKISLKTLTDLLFAIYSTSTEEVEGRNLLSKSESLIRYLLQVVAEKVQYLQSTEKDSKQLKENCSYMASIARILMRVYSTEFESTVEDADGNRNETPKPLTVLSMELLTEITALYRHKSPHLLSHFLYTFKSQNSSSMTLTNDVSYVSLVTSFIKKFQKMVVSLLSEEDEDLKKDAYQQINYILTFLCDLSSYKFAVPSNDIAANTFTWSKNLCKQMNIGDTAVGRKMVSIALQLSNQVEQGDELLQELAVAVRTVIGDFDSDRTAIEGSSQLAIVNRKTAPHLYPLVISNLEEKLLEIDWIQNKLGTDPSRELIEKSVCKRLTLVIDICNHLLQTSAPQSNYESLFQCLSKLYKTLWNFAKHYLLLYNKKCGQLGSNYEKLVKHSGNLLTPKVYVLVNHVQEMEVEVKKKAKLDLIGQKAKVLKSTKPIALLVYNIERYEQRLILLSKKSKVDLMVHFKASSARDYIINYEKVSEAMEVIDEEPTYELDEELNLTPPPTTSSTVKTISQSRSSPGGPQIAKRGGHLGKRKKK